MKTRHGIYTFCLYVYRSDLFLLDVNFKMLLRIWIKLNCLGSAYETLEWLGG